MTKHNLSGHTQPKSAEVRFEQASVHYYSKPSWLGGKPFKALGKPFSKVRILSANNLRNCCLNFISGAYFD